MKHCNLFSDLYRSDQSQQSEQDAARADDADGIRSDRSLCGNPVAQAKVSSSHVEPHSKSVDYVLDADTMSKTDHLQAVDSTEIPRYELKNITVADFTAFLCAFENPLYVHN